MRVEVLVCVAAACAPSDRPVPLYTATPVGFFDAPWPSDARRDPDGTLALEGFPNPLNSALVRTYLATAEELDGFGTTSPIYVPFDGPVDTDRLPSPEESVEDGSALVLADIDPDSPSFGERYPVQWEFRREAGHYVDANVLAVAPVFGFPLPPATKVALVVTTRVARPNDSWPTDADLEQALLFVGLGTDDVAIATVFTTQDPLDEMRRIASFVQDDVAPPPLDAESLELLETHSDYTAWRTRYASPVFTEGDPPYVTEGGEILFAPDGRPLIARWDEMRLAVCVPTTIEEPPSGWPVVIFLNGTGGDYRDFCDGDDPLEVASRLGEVGIVGMGIDLPLQGSRPGADTASDLQHFNVVNPASARTNFRQGAADALVLAHALADRSWTLSSGGIPILRTDPARIMLMGHSQGGLHAALAAPFIGADVSAVVLSGTGGELAITILERKDPFDLAALVSSLLVLDPSEELTPLHPAIGLVQTLVDVTDPVNYAPYWSSMRGPWSGHTPVPVLATSGTADVATPYETSIALAAAARLPAVSDQVVGDEALRLRGNAYTGLPTSDNGWAFDGARHTLGFAQFPGGGHGVVFEDRAASDLYINWLSSTAAGYPALWILDR